MNLGLYGFGKDFYSSYSTANLFYGGYEDRLGWIIATAKIGNFHIGVFLTSFLLSYSSLKIIVHFTEQTIKKRLHILVFLIIAIIILHSWPILMSTSNAMRQGIMMSFLFLTLLNLDRSKNFKAILCLILMLVSHKSGVFFLSILLSAFFFNKYVVTRKQSMLYSIFILFIFTFLISYLPQSRDKIIGYDFSAVWFFIGLVSLIYIRPRSHNRNILSAYVYIFLLFSPVLYFTIASFQFERIWMVNIIIVMLVIINRIKKSQATFLAIIEFLSLTGLTFVTGMFKALT